MKRENYWKFGRNIRIDIKRRAARLLWQSYVAMESGNKERAHDIQRHFKKEFATTIGDSNSEKMLTQTLLFPSYLVSLMREVRA